MRELEVSPESPVSGARLAVSGVTPGARSMRVDREDRLALRVAPFWELGSGADDLDVESGAALGRHQGEPQGQVHLQAARGLDPAEVKDRAPAE